MLRLSLQAATPRRLGALGGNCCHQEGFQFRYSTREPQQPRISYHSYSKAIVGFFYQKLVLVIPRFLHCFIHWAAEPCRPLWKRAFGRCRSPGWIFFTCAQLYPVQAHRTNHRVVMRAGTGNA